MADSDKIKIPLFVEKTCPVCGKKMVRLNWGNYCYRKGGYTFCSYTCMVKYEKGLTDLTPVKEVNRLIPYNTNKGKTKKGGKS